MRAPGSTAIVVMLGGAALLALGGCGRGAPADQSSRATGAPAASVNGGGFTLQSTSIDLPADEAVLPPGPNVDLVNQRCLACHSASMVLTQPRLKPAQWQAIVEKMRDTYHAPVAEGEVSPIVAYLAGRSADGMSAGSER